MTEDTIQLGTAASPRTLKESSSRYRSILITSCIVLSALGMAAVSEPSGVVRALVDPLRAFINPTKRMFLPFLLGGAMLASGVWLVHCRRKCSLLGFLFPRSIWLHRSALLDYRLAIVRALLQVTVLASLAIPVKVVALALARLLWRHAGILPRSTLGDTTILVLFSVTAFVAEDFARYVVHRLAHRVPALWELHKVHHSAEVLTPMTVYRTHPIESIVMRAGAALALAVVTGIFVWMFPGRIQAWEFAGVYGLSFIWNLLGANLRHSHVRLSYGPILEHVFISPTQHQIHHSNDAQHYDTNFGSALALWDWLFGSLRVSRRGERLTFGLPREVRNHGDSVGSVLVAPLGFAVKRLIERRRALAAFMFLGSALLTLPARAQPGTAPERNNGAEVHSPELIAFVEAQYPPLALERHIEGTAVLRLTIDAEGRVTHAELVHAAGHGFDEAAQEAALAFRFRPARRGGTPVASRILYRYAFKLPATSEPATSHPTSPAPATSEPAPPASTPPSPAPGTQVHAPQRVPTREQEPVEVTVLGTPPAKTPGSVHIINQRTLERYGYDDPHAVIQTVPGVYVRQEDGFGLRPNIGLRGAASDRSKKVALMEDGVPFGPAPYSAPAAYYFPLLSRMTAVRVIKGPAAIGYGPQTVGGAIDFMTRAAPADTHGMVDLGGGQYGYGKLHGWVGSTANDGKLAFIVEGIRLQNDGYKELPSGGDTGFYRNEWVLKASYLLDPAAKIINEFSLKASYSDELSNETYLGLSDEDFRRAPLRRYAASKLDQMRWHRTGIAVTHKTRPSAGLEITTTAYRNDLSRSWRKVNRFTGANLFDVLSQPGSPSNAIFHGILAGKLDSTAASESLLIGPNERNFVSQGIQTRVEWATRTGRLEHRVEYGLRLHYDRIERRHTEDSFSLIGGNPVPTGAPTSVTASNEAWTYAVAFHASDAVSWRALTVTPGVRVELLRSALVDHLADTNHRGSAQVVLPGAGAFYALTDTFGILAGAYRGFSPPPPGNAEHLKPELSVNYEAGVRYAGKPARAELIGYYNDYSNLTDVCTLSSGCLDATLDRQFNAGRARIYGAEAYAAHEIPVGPLKLPVSVAYTLTLTEFLSTFDSDDPIFGSVEAGDELPYVPRHQAHGSIGIQGNRASAYAAVTYVSKMREQASSGPFKDSLTTDEQFVFDAGAKYRITPWLELYSNVRNVFDSRYLVSRRPYGARPNAPRWIQLGLKAHF
jgi:Fe(3+) dicitrate transport protein